VNQQCLPASDPERLSCQQRRRANRAYRICWPKLRSRLLTEVIRGCIGFMFALLAALAITGCVTYAVVGEAPTSRDAATKPYSEDLQVGDYVRITYADGHQNGLSLTAVDENSISGTLDSTGIHVQYQREELKHVEARRRNVKGTVALGIAGGIVYLWLLSLFVP
jgi:hypothetical protein